MVTLPEGSVHSTKRVCVEFVYNKDPHLKNLYFAASGSHPGAGIPGVLSSAKVVENVIKNE